MAKIGVVIHGLSALALAAAKLTTTPADTCEHDCSGRVVWVTDGGTSGWKAESGSGSRKIKSAVAERERRILFLSLDRFNITAVAKNDGLIPA